jgi:[pyruvate, water dikinase]-phosphate phosphotransferase / [pyruvate, water dikinase] kinase
LVLWKPGYPETRPSFPNHPQEAQGPSTCFRGKVQCHPLSRNPADRFVRNTAAVSLVHGIRRLLNDTRLCTGFIHAILPRMLTNRLNLHLVSDATGETLNAIARATTVQFEHVHIVYHRWSLIRTRFQLHRVLEGIEAEPGPVLSTLVERGLRTELEAACQRMRVPVVNVLDPVISMLQDALGEQAAARPGRQYVLDADYFRRIDAMHFVLAHDDGQQQASIAEAEVVLVGVSRSSKTPTCFYLANRGIKAANVPLVPGLPEPPGLDDPPCPVIGLTLEPQSLIEIRRHRLKLIAQGGIQSLRHDTAEYVDHESVKAELLWARRMCVRRGWPVIDVTRRSIEETAATVLQLMEAWHTRRAKPAPEPQPASTGATPVSDDPAERDATFEGRLGA